jgi:hypothetical protein
LICTRSKRRGLSPEPRLLCRRRATRQPPRELPGKAPRSRLRHAGARFLAAAMSLISFQCARFLLCPSAELAMPRSSSAQAAPTFHQRRCRLFAVLTRNSRCAASYVGPEQTLGGDRRCHTSSWLCLASAIPDGVIEQLSVHERLRTAELLVLREKAVKRWHLLQNVWVSCIEAFYVARTNQFNPKA